MTAAPLWTGVEAAIATGGRNTQDWSAMGASIDSRTTAKGDLFVAIEGPVFDGHKFVDAAFANGAAAGLVSAIPGELPEASALHVVDDTMAALTALGTASRARTSARIAAVTGSAGKTGTKEALRHVLEAQGPTSASRSSFNNHWGVPLSLARMPAETAFGIFEVGMNHAGEIEPLSRLIQPHVAIITTVEAAHLEYFDSVEAIADAKAEIFIGVEPGGTAVLYRDNLHFERLEAAARRCGITNVVSFGGTARCDVRLNALIPADEHSDVIAEVHGRRIEYRLGVPGRHWVLNSLAVLATVEAFGADIWAAARKLPTLGALAGRGKTHHVTIDGAAIILIDESYNANPASIRTALETLGRIRPKSHGRRIAVLGEMRELGSRSESLHAELADPVTANGIDLVFAAGEMRALFDRLPPGVGAAYGETGIDLIDDIRDAVRPGDVVMIKGSNASRMAAVVEALLDADAKSDNG
jgi:UDP-N-acetylmuramoyl-tripeptide--D-alanyl-D-alanine ligase